MNNSLWDTIWKVLALISGIIGGALGLVWGAKVKRSETLDSKQVLDKTQIEVTHINAHTEYTDDLRGDIKDLKAELVLLKAAGVITDTKWFESQNAILDKQRQLNEFALQVIDLQKQITILKDNALATRQDCEERIGKLHDEIVELNARCRVLENERDEWKAKYLRASAIIGVTEIAEMELGSPKMTHLSEVSDDTNKRVRGVEKKVDEAAETLRRKDAEDKA